jgi:hypothetical protein
MSQLHRRLSKLLRILESDCRRLIVLNGPPEGLARSDEKDTAPVFNFILYNPIECDD